MADLDAIRNALADNLKAAFPDVNVSPYVLSAPNPPQFEVEPWKFEFDRAIRTDELRFKVHLLGAFSLDIGGQQVIDEFLSTSGPQSVKAALEADSTLGGLVDDLRVEEMSSYGIKAVAGRGGALGCDWTVCVLATRD